MERLPSANENFIYNAELGRLRGRHVYAFNEPGHSINYYEAKLGEGTNITCTSCHAAPPVVIRHEIDHMSRQYFEAFCSEHIPPVVQDAIQSKNNDK
jgi:hypothetical protein